VCAGFEGFSGVLQQPLPYGGYRLPHKFSNSSASHIHKFMAPDGLGKDIRPFVVKRLGVCVTAGFFWGENFVV
jgi:hypothetical protein